ncbi:MAG TPA: sigma 54-interacting transcriptional regulator [Polyangia bacterium]|nr:sigma 54-interacting transcriptional regulator [Polyangia bacterium]
MTGFDWETETDHTAEEHHVPADRVVAGPRDPLVRERDQLAMVLRISQAAASLDLNELIGQVAKCFQTSRWRWDYTSLFLYEPSEQGLRQHSLYATPGLIPDVSKYNGTLIPLEGSQSGQAFLTGEPSVVNSRAEYEAVISRPWAADAMKHIPATYSCCIVPLTSRDRRLGTLVSACVRDRGFDAEAVQFLRQIAHAIAPAVDNAMAYRKIDELRDRLSKEKVYFENELSAGLGEIVGSSAAMRRVLSLVQSVAATDSTVLIHGETGTGKELVARAVHQKSQRHAATFVRLNCAAIPTGLIESELFGHERGSFTGAVSQKIGRFELADGGTLFLDEIGEIPLDVQPKLLRVLQEREFERLGGSRTIKVNVRVIAATNRRLDEMVASRTFRNDLFYRLNVFPIVVPTLRERREDIPPLVRHFVDRCARRMKKSITMVPTTTLESLSRYDWPGNVRELENVIERSVILSPGPELVVPAGALDAVVMQTAPSPGPARSTAPEGGASGTPQTLADAERTFILRALEQARWVVAGRGGAAARLGLSRTTLQGRMRKLGISRPRLDREQGQKD